MYEVLTRPHEIVPVQPTLVSVSTIAKRLKEQEVRREQRRQVQIDLARKRNARLQAEANGVDLTENGEAIADGGKRSRTEASERNDPAKRRKTDTTSTSSTPLHGTAPEVASPRSGHTLTETGWVTRVISDVRGHTSYLTFATMYPRSVNQAIEQRESAKLQGRRQFVKDITTQVIDAVSAVPAQVTADQRILREGSADTEITNGSFERGVYSHHRFQT